MQNMDHSVLTPSTSMAPIGDRGTPRGLSGATPSQLPNIRHGSIPSSIAACTGELMTRLWPAAREGWGDRADDGCDEVDDDDEATEQSDDGLLDMLLLTLVYAGVNGWCP